MISRSAAPSRAGGDARMSVVVCAGEGRSRLEELVHGAGFGPGAPPGGGAWLVIVDLAHEREASLDALAALGDRGDAVLLAVVPDGSPAALEEAIGLGAEGLVGTGAIELELPARLQALRRTFEVRGALRERERDLRTLVELTRSFAGTLEPGELLPEVTRRLAKELSLRRCSFVLVDEGEQVGRVVASSDAEAVSDRRIDLARYPEILEAVRTRRAIVLADASRHPLLDPFRDAISGLGLGALAVLPLVLEDRVLGVLFLRASGDRESLGEREIGFAEAVANAAAVALRNARSVQAIRTQVERAEARASQLARFEELFSGLLDGIAVTAVESGRLITMNPAGLQILGIGWPEAQGARIRDLVTPHDDAHFRALAARVAAGEAIRGEELAVTTTAGRQVHLAISISRLPDADVVIHSFHDVTEHRRSQLELQRTKDFLEKLVDSTIDGIIACDPRGNVVLFNKGAEELLGYGASEVVGKIHVTTLYPDGGAREVMRQLRAPDHGGPGRLRAMRLDVRHRSGQAIPVQLNAVLIEEDGRAVATVGIFSDLRERMRIEGELLSTQERLERSERQAMIVELAGTAAHELNQPLTSVMGYAELLRRKMKDEDPSYRAIDIIFREAERMAEIVRKIGRITRYETKQYVGRSRIVDLDRSTDTDTE